MPDESRKRKGVKSKMSTDNDYGTTSTVKNKKRMPTWLVILLILVLFAGGVLAGLKLATINEPTGLWARMFPEAVEPTMTAVPTATQKPSESAKPAAAAKPSAKPTESTKPTASAKPEESTAPAESAKPEASTKPEESAKPETSAAPTEATQEPSAPAAPEYIEPETAVDAALKHAKVSEKDADVYKARIEELRGTSVYIIGFTAGDADYEYEINALTGKVEGWASAQRSCRGHSGSRFCVGEQRHKQRGRLQSAGAYRCAGREAYCLQPRGHSRKGRAERQVRAPA